MNNWQRFLDSLASKGGNLLLMALFVVSLLTLVIWVTSRDQGDSQAVTVILSTFSAFSGALLAALTGQVGGQRKTDNGKDQPTAPASPPGSVSGASHP
jgi:FtsH-binding integral membrane protein